LFTYIEGLVKDIKGQCFVVIEGHFDQQFAPVQAIGEITDHPPMIEQFYLIDLKLSIAAWAIGNQGVVFVLGYIGCHKLLAYELFGIFYAIFMEEISAIFVKADIKIPLFC